MADRNHGRQGRVRGRPTPLDTARECFALLTAGPQPLSVDGREYPGLPNRLVPLDELRARLLRRQCSRKTRDKVWAHLVLQSRTHGAAWTLACTGMALPALAGVVRWLSPRFPGDVCDLHAEVVSGFLQALSTVAVDRPGVMVRLRWSAYRSGFATLKEALDAPTPIAPGFQSSAPQPPWGHPDLVLARAVRLSVLTRTEADLIGTTRLEDVPISDWADRRRTTVQAAYKARRRAEQRLVAFLRDEAVHSDPEDPVATYVAAELAPAGMPSRPQQRSRRVTNGPTESRTAEAGVSKPATDPGLLGCGGSPDSLASHSSSEV